MGRGEGVGLGGGGGSHQFRDARALVELKGQVALYMAHSNINKLHITIRRIFALKSTKNVKFCLYR